MMLQDWDIGNLIRVSRMKKGYTQEQLAELLDITPGHLKHMESGKRKPSVPLLFQMMRLLDFSVDAVVFPEQENSKIIHLDGLTDAESDAVIRLVDVIKQGKNTSDLKL